MEPLKSTGAKSEALDKSDDRARSGHDKTPRPKGKVKNNVRKFRMERMMSKAELARRAQISSLTVDRVERGMSCRMDTKRKILEALGLKPQDRVMVFGDSEDD
jgi:ribosome-binding protein aMBF1 (putative translation factor)